MAIKLENYVEKRKYFRHGWNEELAGLPVSGNGFTPVERFRAVDISDGGLGVISQTSQQAGRKFLLALPRTGGGRLFVKATVVRSTPGFGGHHVGLNFDDMPDTRQVRVDVPISQAA
jgi:c-di-GMP-binding flagellar brake protein YcgR